MTLNGWLTNLQCHMVILAIIYLSGFLRRITIDCSNIEATLPLANDVRDQVNNYHCHTFITLIITLQSSTNYPFCYHSNN